MNTRDIEMGKFLFVSVFNVWMRYSVLPFAFYAMNYAKANFIHDIPSFSSMSATLLKEKLVLPERMRLTY